MSKFKVISKNVVEIDGQRYIKENSEGWLDIPELGISVEKEVHDKDKSLDDLGLKDREKELLTVEQCIFLANSKYAKDLKMDGSSSKDDFFIQQPFELNRRKGWVARFFADSYGVGFGTGYDSDDSYSTLGVRFVRPLDKK